MKKLLIAAVCLLLTSCGLFTKTVTKRKLEQSRSAAVEVSKAASKTSEVSSVDLSIGGRISATPSKTGTATGRINNGVGIVTDSAGLLLVALIDSLSGNLTIGYSIPGGYSYDWWRDSASRARADHGASASDSSSAIKEQVSAAAVDKERKPNFIGTIGLWIGIGIVVVAAIWAVAKFVFKR